METLVRYFAPDASPAAYNDWQLRFASSLSGEAKLMLVALLFLAFWATWTGLARLNLRRRRALMLLRVFGAASVLVLLLMPALELRAVSKVRSRVALLIDDSRSMSLHTRDGTRIQAVRRHLAENRTAFAKLQKTANLETFVFSKRLRPSDLQALRNVAKNNKSEPADSDSNIFDPRGSETDFAQVIGELKQQASGRDLGAVILYSDGTDTKGLTVQRAEILAQSLDVPIYAIGFSGASAAADLAISRIVGDDFAFVHNTVAIDVDLEEKGLRLSSVMVSLRKAQNIVATKEAVFDAEGRARVSFEFKPRSIGKLAYEITVPVQEGEAVLSNNRRSLVLKVIRDRIRVLQVAGRPSWDERFLRELLKRNPNIDLISFFILRTPTDIQRASQDELALIPFPVNELFTKELSTFDVVIYQNFNYRPYRMAHYLRNIQDYVLQGGSFLMIGGDQSFNDGFYAATPISTILPVRLGGVQAWDPAKYQPRLTDYGRDHPITRIGEPGEPPELVFSRLPALEGVNPSLGLMPGARALLTHPSLPQNPPVVSIRDVGRGRSMAVNTDTIWFWRFASVSDGGAGREFDRFWNRSLRWLIRDPELARVRLKTSKSVHSAGEDVTAEVKVLGRDEQGAVKATVSAELSMVKDGQRTLVKRISMKVGSEGKAPINLGKLIPGHYSLKTEAHVDGASIGVAEEPIVVEASQSELQSPFPRSDILRAFTTASGGQYAEVSEALPDIKIKNSRRVQINRTRQIPLWDTRLALLLLLGLLGTEWWLRRRWGLL